MRFLLFYSTLLAILQPILCWGDLGHRTVAYLGQKYFTEEASQFTDTLLANNNSWDISDASTWADVVKRRRPETGQWHWIDAQDAPPKLCAVNYTRDCNSEGVPGCIVSAITNMTALAIHSENTTVQKEAVMFLIHFIGDIHQPLHTENASRGGNDIHVCFDSDCSKMNLHGVWDTEILLKHIGLRHGADDGEEKDAAAKWADELYNMNQARGMTTARECTNPQSAQTCALKWATEANKWICKYVLTNGTAWLEENDLGEDYYEGAVPIVEDLVGKAGLRLGSWLNAIAAARSSRVSLVAQTAADVAATYDGQEL